MLLIAGLTLALAAAQYNPYIPSPPPPEAFLPPPPPTVIPPPPGGWRSTGPQATYIPPPPLDPKLKNFPLDLDLEVFAKRNPYPTEHCFFPVKGRKKDFVEFAPDEIGGTYKFSTGWCSLSEKACTLAKRNMRPPFFKKGDPPIHEPSSQWSSYDGFPVIPYRYVDDIDFSTCMPTWKGYFEVDDLSIQPYEKPKRNYSKLSCYHPFNAGYQGQIFCDSEKCQLSPNQYCEHKTGQCYLNDFPLKNKKGKSVTFFESAIYINWDFCTDEEGRLIPEDGGPPYEERFQPGCSYRINAPNFHEKQYAGNTDFLIKCDEYRCFNPSLKFDMQRKEYISPYSRDTIVYTKTPPLSEILTVDWTCQDAAKVPDYNKKLLCTYMNTDGKDPDCELCYQNKKFVYKNCRLQYDELGQRKDIPEELRQYDLFREANGLYPVIDALYIDGEIDVEMQHWFLAFTRKVESYGPDIDRPKRHEAAALIAQFRKPAKPVEKDTIRLREKLSSLISQTMKDAIETELEGLRKSMCYICETSTKEARVSNEAVRGACGMCRN